MLAMELVCPLQASLTAPQMSAFPESGKSLGDLVANVDRAENWGKNTFAMRKISHSVQMWGDWAKSW